MTFDLLGYIDSLLNDLSLTSHRKGWFKYWMAPSSASDFGELYGEYIKRYGEN